MTGHRRWQLGLMIGGSVVGLGALWLLVRAWMDPSAASYLDAVDGSAAGVVAWAVVVATWAWRGYFPSAGRRSAWVAAFAGALICATLVWMFGHRHFGGFDHSVLIDVGYRLASGQKPVWDFPSTLPIGFVLGAGYAFKIFGVAWSSVIAWQALFASVTFLWSYALVLRLTGSVSESALVAFAVQASSSVVTSYWWYNSATTVIAAVFFLSAVAWWRRPRERVIEISYVVALILLAAMKPNIAGVLIFGVSLTLFCSRAHRGRVILYSLGSLVVFVAWLALEKVRLTEIIHGYLSISGRGFSLAQFLQDLTPKEKLVAKVMLVASLLPWVTLFYIRPRFGHAFWLAVAGVLAGGYGYLTNGESKWVDLPLFLLALWWLGTCGRQEKEAEASAVGRFWKGWGTYVAGLSALLVMGGISVGALRQRVRSIEPGNFFEYQVAKAPLKTPFFKGMESGPTFVAVEAEVARLLSAKASRRVFFGPRMQWGYAAFGLASPVGQPVWWHVGVSYPLSDQPAYAAAWAANPPDVAIFLGNQSGMTLMPREILEVLSRDYVLVSGYPLLLVLERRKGAEAPAEMKAGAEGDTPTTPVRKD